LINKSKDGETAFRSAWKELKDKGYLIQHKLKDGETKQFYYEYEICNNPHDENPPVAIKPTDPYNEIPHVEIPPVESLNNSITTSGVSTKKKTHSYNNTINNNTISNNTLYINIIQTNIDYKTVFLGSSDQELVDNIVDIMVDVLINNYETIKINNGDIQSTYVKAMLLKVNMNHILYTVNTINNYKEKINNMRNFILSVLYNSVQTLDSYYQNLVSI